MAEDSEPRIARIRENLVDGLGPFELMADIIVGSQHGPNNSGLFGIVQSPIRPLRPPVLSTEPRMTAIQMAQKMQSIVDAPLSTIETNLPFKKNQERKNNAVKNTDSSMPSTSSMNATNNSSGSNEKPSTSFSRTDDNNAYRKRKRRRSDCKNTDAENWQKPCTSGSAVKMETDNGKMTINELFGEEKRDDERGTYDELKHIEKKDIKREKDEQESPDSGFADEISDNNREQSHRPRLQSMIGELGRISPLLTPPRQPQKNGSPSLPVLLNLDKLKASDRERIRNVYRAALLGTIAAPSRVLSPPLRPTSTNERVASLQSSNTERLVTSPKPVSKTTSGSTTTAANNSSNVATAAANNKKQNVHSAAATPSWSSTKDLKKENRPRCDSASSTDRKHELAAVKNDDLKITLVKRFIKQQDKTYVATSGSTTTTTTSKESGKHNRKDESGYEQAPSTSKLDKKSVQHQKSFSTSSGKLDEAAKEKEKKKRLDSSERSSREKDKLSASTAKVEEKQDEQQHQQQSDSAATTQQRDLKKKQTNGTVLSNSNSNSNDDKADKAAKSSKSKEDGAPPAKKCKKDVCLDKNSTANSAEQVQGSGVFICCSSRTAPTKKSVLEKNEDGTYKSSAYYQEVARTLKCRAEKEIGDHVRRTLAFMDAAVYLILSSAIPSGTNTKENRQRQYSVTRDSAELMKTIIKWSGSSASLSQLERHFLSRFKMLSSRIQAVLNYYLYSLKTGSCMSIFGTLTKNEPHLLELDAIASRNDGAASVSSQSGSSANTATPSPASSTNSGGNGERQKEVNVPVFLYQAQRSQLSILHHLMWSDRLWKQTSVNMTSSEQETVRHLDQLCGPMTVDSSLYSVAEYLATAVTWLRAEYRAEKEQTSSLLQQQQ